MQSFRVDQAGCYKHVYILLEISDFIIGKLRLTLIQYMITFDSDVGQRERYLGSSDQRQHRQMHELSPYSLDWP